MLTLRLEILVNVAQANAANFAFWSCLHSFDYFSFLVVVLQPDLHFHIHAFKSKSSMVALSLNSSFDFLVHGSNYNFLFCENDLNLGVLGSWRNKWRKLFPFIKLWIFFNSTCRVAFCLRVNVVSFLIRIRWPNPNICDEKVVNTRRVSFKKLCSTESLHRECVNSFVFEVEFCQICWKLHLLAHFWQVYSLKMSWL